MRVLKFLRRRREADSPLTVVQIASGDLWAGAEVMAFSLISELRNDPHLKLIAILLNEGILSKKLQEIGVEVYVVPEHTHSFITIYWKTWNYLKGRRVDIIHSHRSKENLLNLMLSVFLMPKYVISTFHGWSVEYFEDGKKRLRLVTKLDYFILRTFFSRVVPVSRDLKNGLIQSYGFKENKVGVIHNGVNTGGVSRARNREAHQTFHIGTVGRMVPQKDFELFLEIAALVIAQVENVKFSILGDGPLKDSLGRRIKDLGLEDKVELLLPRPDPFPYYHSLDMYLNTSLFEGIPLTILEAMVCGVPVVAAAVGGNPEVISHDEDGYLVPGRDPLAFVQPCLELIRDPSLVKRMGMSAITKVTSCFSVDRMAESYKALYLC